MLLLWLSFEASVNALVERDMILSFKCHSWCCVFIHCSLEVVCFLCPCFSLSVFYLLGLHADVRTDDA